MEDLEEDKLYYVKLNNGDILPLFYCIDEWGGEIYSDGTTYFHFASSEYGIDYIVSEVPSYKEVTKLKEDINTLKNIILKLSPSHREYLEKNFKD